MPQIGDVFVDQDPRAVGRTLHVVMVVKRIEHAVNKDYAVCIARGKTIVVSVNRLMDRTRFVWTSPLVPLGSLSGEI